MTIYLDFVWGLNLLIDFIILLITCAFLRRKSSVKRLLFGALIASLIVPLTFLFHVSFFHSFFGKIVYSLLIILSAFPFKSLASYLNTLFSFYFISFMIGGGLIGIHYLINSPMSLVEAGPITFNKGFGDPVSWGFVLVSFPFVVLFSKRRFQKYTIENIKYNELYRMTITIDGIKERAVGFMDSGNQLVDPLTNNPVIIADGTILKRWFKEDEWSELENLSSSLKYMHIPEKWTGRINIIPYRTIDGESKMLTAIKPDKVSLFLDEKEIEREKVLIGIRFTNLSKDKSFNCLLQPRLFH